MIIGHLSEVLLLHPEQRFQESWVSTNLDMQETQYMSKKRVAES